MKLNMKNFHLVAGIVFLLIALVQLWRAIAGWTVIVNEMEIPLWLSWVAFVIAGFLAYNAFYLRNR